MDTDSTRHPVPQGFTTYYILVQGLIGMDTTPSSYTDHVEQDGHVFGIQSIVNFPEAETINAKTRGFFDRHTLASIAARQPQQCAQILLPIPGDAPFEPLAGVASAIQVFLDLLQMKSSVPLGDVAVSDHSWNCFEDADDESVYILVQTSFDYTQQPAQGEIRQDDFIWAIDHHHKGSVLEGGRGDSRFRSGVELLHVAMTNRSDRVAVAAAWSGIDGLLGIEYELKFRTALSCAVILGEDAEARSRIFSEVQSLYNERSRAVHGGSVKRGRPLSAVRSDSVDLLAGLLCAVVERFEAPPSPDDVTKALLAAEVAL